MNKHIKNMKKILLFTAAAALLFAACAKNDGEDLSFAGQVRISPLLTKATDTAFETGDQIGVTITTSDSTAYATNEILTYSDGVFSGDLIWYTGTSTSTLVAYYPYDENGTPTTFTVSTDQIGGITSNDLIAGVLSDAAPSEDALSVSFKHQLSKILVKVTNESNYSISAVKLTGAYLTADVDVAALTAGASETSETGDITAYASTEGELYAAIIVPQTVALGLSVTNSGGEELTAALASTTLVQGGQYTVNVTVEDNSIKVTLSGDVDNWDDQGEIGGDSDPSFEEYDGYFIYDGVTYNTVTLSNGSTWMAEPLRYVPDGYTPSSDASDDDAHIWYPYETDGTTTTALTDDDSVESNGYLYDLLAVFGTDSIDDDNAASFEGCQGICPEGWHVPTRAEYFALCGNSNKSADEDATQYDETALFYDSDYSAGRIGLFNDGGWNFVMSGARMKSSFSGTGKYQTTVTKSSTCSVEEWIGLPALTYLATSTYYKSSEGSNCQFFVGMTTFTSTYSAGKVSLAYGHYETGMQVRCIKDSTSE